MPKVPARAAPRFQRKQPSDYRLVQFRSDSKTKSDLEKSIESLARILKKDPRFKRFRKNDIYITCLTIGINHLSRLVNTKDPKADDIINQYVQFIETRRELQWANDKTPKALSQKKFKQ
jgi:hypothetical protein